MELARLPVRRIAWRIAEGIDQTLLVLALSLTMLGLAALFSAAYQNPARLVGQLGNLAVALVAMWCVAQLSPQALMRFALPAYPVEEVVDPTGAGDAFAGGFMGYLASAKDTGPAALRRAMLFGTVTASFCVEGFSVDALANRDRAAIEARYKDLASLVTP